MSNSLDAVAPILVFLVLNRVAGLRWAVVGATIWSIKVAISRYRRGLPFGRFLPLVTVAVIGRGVIGVLTDSEALYFGLGIGTKYLVAVALIGSAIIGSPLAAIAVKTIFPVSDETARNRLFLSTMTIVTAIAGLYYVISASFDVWLYRRSSIEGYVIVRFVVNWPLSATAAIMALLVMRRRLRAVPGLGPLQELLGVAPLPPAPEM